MGKRFSRRTLLLVRTLEGARETSRSPTVATSRAVAIAGETSPSSREPPAKAVAALGSRHLCVLQWFAFPDGVGQVGEESHSACVSLKQDFSPHMLAKKSETPGLACTTKHAQLASASHSAWQSVGTSFSFPFSSSQLYLQYAKR